MMRLRLTLPASCVVAVIGILSVQLDRAVADPSTARRGVVASGAATAFRISPPIRELEAEEAPSESGSIVPAPQEPGISSGVPTPDAELLALNPLAPLQPLDVIEGINFDAGQGSGYPQDPNLAAGAYQVVTMLNSGYIRVFNRGTGALLAPPRSISSIFAASNFPGKCSTTNSGDGIVQYDKLADRWVLLQPVFVAPYQLCVAVSTTPDALGSWYLYSFPVSGGYPDFPKLGVWPDGYYILANLIPGSPKIYVLQRSQMLAGVPSAAYQVVESPFGLPADLDGVTPPPAGSPEYIVERFLQNNVLNIRRLSVNWSNSALTTLSPPQSINIVTKPFPNSVPQSGTTQTLSGGGGLEYRAAYRRFGTYESLVIAQSVFFAPSNSDSLEWFELRWACGTPPCSSASIFQQGVFSPDSSYRFLPSIAMDRLGDIGVGYSVSSSSIYPGIRFTGREPGDGAGAMRDEISIIEGSAPAINPLGRWGDYTSMSVEPVFDCGFWYINSYLPSPSVGISARVGSFRFSDCTHCVGDCNRNYAVSIDEQIRGVNISLGNQPISNCYRADDNGDGDVLINELILATNAALNGCTNSSMSTMNVGTAPPSLLTAVNQQIGSASGARGTSVSISVTLTGGLGQVAGSQLDLLYPDILTNASCVKAGRLTQHSLSTSTPSTPSAPAGKVRLRTLVADIGGGRTFSDGTMFTCTFTIKSTAAPGTYGVLGDRGHVGTADGSEPPSSVTDGQITVF